MIGDKNVVYNVTGAVLIDNKIDKENVKLKEDFKEWRKGAQED